MEDYSGYEVWLDAFNPPLTDEELEVMASEYIKSNKESIETLKSAQGVSHEKQLQSR